MISPDRRAAIVAAADACTPRHTPEWAYAARAAMTPAEAEEIDNQWYAMTMPRPPFSEVLRRVLLDTR